MIEIKQRINICTAETTGVVVSVRSEYKDDTMTYYTTVEYNVNNQQYYKKGESGVSHKRGESVKVMYNPDNPKVSYIPGCEETDRENMIYGIFCISASLKCVFDAFNKKRR